MRQAAEELVERARLGDQVAVGTIVEVRKNAERGNPRAVVARQLMLDVAQGRGMSRAKVGNDRRGSPLASLRDHLRRHKSPDTYAAHVAGAVAANGNSVKDAHNAAQAISGGPLLGPKMFDAIDATFGAEPDKKAFAYGLGEPPQKVLAACKQCQHPSAKRALQLGYTLGLASRLQAARRGNIAALSPKAAWELS